MVSKPNDCPRLFCVASPFVALPSVVQENAGSLWSRLLSFSMSRFTGNTLSANSLGSTTDESQASEGTDGEEEPEETETEMDRCCLHDNNNDIDNGDHINSSSSNSYNNCSSINKNCNDNPSASSSTTSICGPALATRRTASASGTSFSPFGAARGNRRRKRSSPASPAQEETAAATAAASTVSTVSFPRTRAGRS